MSYGSNYGSSDRVNPLWWIGGVIGVVFAIWLFIFVIDWVGSRATPQGGQIGVVRSGPDPAWVGAWFNGHDIKTVVAPGSGSTYIGLGSDVHWYPADTVQRQYTITSDPSGGDQTGVDFVQVPTEDGIEVRVDGTFFFTTGFNASPAGKALVKDFDNRFGTRQFNVNANSNNQLYPWQGNAGWESFLNTVVRPIINNDLRVEIGKYKCAQLQSSCALVYQQSVSAVNNGVSSNATLNQIQQAINSSLESDIKATLGEDYFQDPGSSSAAQGIQFRLSDVRLPPTVQQEIENAQAQFAKVGTSRARVQQAKLDAEANQEREKGYLACPACAEAAVLAAIPSNVTTFAPGANFAVTPGGK